MRIKHIVHLATDSRARAQRARWRELYRVRSLPRHVHATTAALGPPIEVVDGASFFSQYCAIFENGCYSAAFDRLDPVILDCGANIGLASLYWKREYPAARITAFEPDAEIAAVARRNLTACGAPDVDMTAAAVWTAVGTVHFDTEGADSGRLSVDPSSIAVPAIRLRDWLEQPVDLLKLDIEGAETDVLLDCADRLENVRRIVFEYHSLVDRPQQLGKVVGVLEEAGFRLTLKHEYASEHPLVRVEAAIGMDLRLNVYGVR